MSNRDAPGDLARSKILESLRTVSVGGSPIGELAPYVEQDMDRFLLTFNLSEVPAVDVLEIGANPYFLTILLRWFRPEWRMELLNFFGTPGGRNAQQVTLADVPRAGLPAAFDMEYATADIETEGLPYPDARFDLVYFCEVLEHFIVDPFYALSEITRCLKVGGHLVLTTPNVARLENVARMIAGSNLYDPYSGHGPHGRHNREYTRHEVAWLLQRFGYEAVNHFTADVHPNSATVSMTGLSVPPGREHDLGQYQFHLWRKSDAIVSPLRPAWLYRSRSDELDQTSL
jgi:SAM-dependent methyltransferase